MASGQAGEVEGPIPGRDVLMLQVLVLTFLVASVVVIGGLCLFDFVLSIVDRKREWRLDEIVELEDRR
jgi:hypothetical protein